MNGSFPYECVGCKHKFRVQAKKPTIHRPTYFKTECPNCGSGAEGQLAFPKVRENNNHFRVTSLILRPSEKLKGMLRNGEVEGNAMIVAPAGTVVK